VEIIFSIGYESDFRKAISILQEIASTHDKIIQSIEKTIRVKTLDASSVNVLFRVWCKNSDYWTVHFDCTELAKDAFDRNGIKIPFPQMELHMNQESLKAMAMEELRNNSINEI
jgi:small conductance mechanosensitive channel